MPSRITLGALLCLIAAFFLAREESRGTFTRFEEGWVSWLLANSPGAVSAPEVTLIQIDDSKDQIFESWPLSPGDYTLVFEGLENLSPGLIGLTPALKWDAPGLLYTSLVDQVK